MLIAWELLGWSLYRIMKTAIKKKRIKTGQSLIEVLLALTVAAVILGAIVTAVISSLSNAQFAKNQNLASQFASQGMELIKQIRDTEDQLTEPRLDDKAGQYCFGEDAKLTDAASCSQNVGGVYVRTIDIEQNSTECNAISTNTYYVIVSVAWWGNECTDPTDFCHKVKLASCLTKREQIRL